MEIICTVGLELVLFHFRKSFAVTLVSGNCLKDALWCSRYWYAMSWANNKKSTSTMWLYCSSIHSWPQYVHRSSTIASSVSCVSQELSIIFYAFKSWLSGIHPNKQRPLILFTCILIWIQLILSICFLLSPFQFAPLLPLECFD